ncbi:response regulator [Geomonas azotofigens]|uniref:response regulator n=1 Tax=Geomonas azotofigens TaxID=2843196 RepID=UPI001C0F9FBB|nr:response regulator transcription factor [Geomonas azotofigens]MBU5614516.1 response regulator transcription factor [Geomonas azotofigens]
MAAKSRVIIVDDHPLFRDGLKSLIARSSKYETVGEAGSGEEALRLAQELKPDLMTMDVSLPDMSGIEATRKIVQSVPSVKILMLSMYQNLEYATDSFKAGARGYIVKEATSDRLIEAMDALSQGEHFLDGQLSGDMVIRHLSGQGKDGGVQDARYALLSAREQQVMRLVAEGGSSRSIADQLQVSAKTVENHRTNLMKKLDVHSRIELVRYAARLGLIDLEQWK